MKHYNNGYKHGGGGGGSVPIISGNGNGQTHLQHYSVYNTQ